MKNKFIIIFAIICGILPYAFSKELNKSDIKSIKTTPWIFLQNSQPDILLFQRADADGFVFIPDDFGEVHLKDSYLQDEIFRKKCIGEIPPQWITQSEHIPGSYDNYDPFYIRYHSPEFIDPDRYMFEFYRELYSHTQTTFQKSFKGEVFGYKKPLWTQNVWKFIEYEFTHKKRPLILTEEPYSKLYSPSLSPKNSLSPKINSGKFAIIDNKIYNEINQYKTRTLFFQKPYFKPVKHYSKWNLGWSESNIEKEKKLLEQSSQSIDSPWTCKETNLPIMLVDAGHHAGRIDKDDWSINSYLNTRNGDFFAYFFFDKELDCDWPLYIRDWALDHLAGVHQCRKSTVGVMLNPKEKTILQNPDRSFSPNKIIFSLNEKNKPWSPVPVPENKNDIPKERLHYNGQPGRLFGSYSKVWELGIWERLGMMFKLNPKAEIYLCGYGTLLQAAETKTVEEEHALIKKCGVFMTAELYSEFEKLRKSQK